MNTNWIGRWILNFAVSALVVGGVWAFFEYFIFGSVRDVSRLTLFSVLIGAVFATAQTVLTGRMTLSAPIAQPPAAFQASVRSAASKSSAKRSRPSKKKKSRR